MRQITHFILQAQEIQCCTPSRVRCIHALRVYAEVAGFVGLQGEQKQQRAPWLFFSVQRLRSFRQVVQHACKSVAYEQIRLIDANTSSIFRR